MTPFPHLFSPIQVGSKTLEHRLTSGAHAANMSAGAFPRNATSGTTSNALERARGGAAMIAVESAVTEWRGDAAAVIDLLDGTERRIDGDALVLATVNAPERSLPGALADSGREVHAIGDCVAARQAPAAIYEGRNLALAL